MSSWKDVPVEWMLDGEPWTRYRVLTGLLGRADRDGEVVSARAEVLVHPDIVGLMDGLSSWFPKAVTKHNTPILDHFRLGMLVDLGLRHDDPGMVDVVAGALDHTEDGLLALRQADLSNIKGYPKIDDTIDEWHAMPCDSPVLLSTLLRSGVRDDRLKVALGRLQEKWLDLADGGWFCHAGFMEGIHRKLGVPCPVSGLMALDAFAAGMDAYGVGSVDDAAIQKAMDALRYHRDAGRSVYYFGRGKRFWSMKYPLLWYNGLYMLDILSRIPQLHDDPVTVEAQEWLLSMLDDEGKARPTSIFMPYKTWSFSNKKEPSHWMTYIAHRILRRLS